MKLCPNSNCIIYTRLDELPDTYTRCPQCGTPLVESTASSMSGRLDSSMLAEEDTSPYSPPPSRPGYAAPLRGSKSSPVEYEQYADPYDASAYEDDPADMDEPLRTLPPRSPFPLRALGVGVVVAVLVVACLALVIGLGGRFLPRSSSFASASSTQTAVSALRPPVNTPLSILPTLPASGPVAQPPPANPGAGTSNSTGSAAPAATAVPSGSTSGAPAPVADALMCVRLDSGQPVGTTDAYKPTDPFNLAVKADYGPGGVTTVLTRWYGPDGKQIYEMKQGYAQPGAYYTGFTVSKSSPWIPGDYRVDIYTNNTATPSRTVQFTVLP